MTTQFDYAGAEAVRAVVGLFRQLYSHTEPTSFHAIRQLLADHIRQCGSALEREALDALNEYRDIERKIFRGKARWRSSSPAGRPTAPRSPRTSLPAC
jgi:hypothetical protein